MNLKFWKYLVPRCDGIIKLQIQRLMETKKTLLVVIVWPGHHNTSGNLYADQKTWSTVITPVKTLQLWSGIEPHPQGWESFTITQLLLSLLALASFKINVLQLTNVLYNCSLVPVTVCPEVSNWELLGKGKCVACRIKYDYLQQFKTEETQKAGRLH